MKSNMDKIAEKFTVAVDKEKYAAGWTYICRKCGMAAYSIEGFFPCQNQFVPLKIWCTDCGVRWVFSLEVTEEDQRLLKEQRGSWVQ